MRNSGRWGFGYLGAVQSFTSTAASQATTAFNAQTTAIRVATTQAIRVVINDAPTALATSTLMPSGAVEYFVTKGGDKLALIWDTAAGNVTVTEMTA